MTCKKSLPSLVLLSRQSRMVCHYILDVIWNMIRKQNELVHNYIPAALHNGNDFLRRSANSIKGHIERQPENIPDNVIIRGEDPINSCFTPLISSRDEIICKLLNTVRPFPLPRLCWTTWGTIASLRILRQCSVGSLEETLKCWLKISVEGGGDEVDIMTLWIDMAFGMWGHGVLFFFFSFWID